MAVYESALDLIGDTPIVDISPLSPNPKVRILAKRCRYAAEAVAPVIGKPARRLGEAAEDLQEVLGEQHDAVVAEAWLRQAGRAPRRDAALVAGELVCLQRAAAAEARSSWPTAWKACSAKRVTSWF